MWHHDLAEQLTMTKFKAVLPQPTNDSIQFWAACNDGRLTLSRCRECHTTFYYPRLACPQCGAGEVEPVASAGRGKVYSYSHVHMSFYGHFWDAELPYTVVLVDLDEGPRMLSRLIGDDRSSVAMGAWVELTFETVEGQKLPFFRLAQNSIQPTPEGAP
jgi:uncharacterized OB-fold protein